MSTNPSTSTPPGHPDSTATRVLHVDSSAEFTSATRDFLERSSSEFDIHSVNTVKQGLRLLESKKFDCVVSEYEMAGQDGLDLLQAVRDSHPDLPFILFTESGSEEVASQAITDGVSGYLLKGNPDQFELLATRILSLVERPRKSDALAAIQERNERLGRVSADAFFEWNPATNKVWRSDGYSRVFDYGDDEVGDDFDWWKARLHPSDRERVLHRLHSVLEDGLPRYEDSFRFKLGNGTYGHVSARACVTYDCENQPKTVTGALTDISDRIIRERELQRSNTRLELALEGTDTGVWEWDLESDEVIWDETTARLFGVQPDTFEADFESYLSLIHAADRQQVRQAIDSVLETGESASIVHRTHPDHTSPVRWIEGKGRLIQRGGVPVRMVGLCRDITTARERQLQLERQAEQLSEFAGLVSHDLRGPLSVASGYLELIDPIDDAQSESIAAVAKMHRKMDTLVSNLLSLAQQGQPIGTLSPVSVAAVAQTAWNLVETEGATLRVEPDATILADEDRLPQLLQNLFQNAVVHGTESRQPDDVQDDPDRGEDQLGIETGQASVERDTGPMTVSVGWFQKPGTDSESVGGLFVSDQGPGIDEAHRDQVFDAGFSLSSGGTGFGLAIVHRIATAHGWGVRVTESDTGGARFEFTGVKRVRGEEGSPSWSPESGLE